MSHGHRYRTCYPLAYAFTYIFSQLHQFSPHIRYLNWIYKSSVLLVSMPFLLWTKIPRITAVCWFGGSRCSLINFFLSIIDKRGLTAVWCPLRQSILVCLQICGFTSNHNIVDYAFLYFFWFKIIIANARHATLRHFNFFLLPVKGFSICLAADHINMRILLFFPPFSILEARNGAVPYFVGFQDLIVVNECV